MKNRNIHNVILLFIIVLVLIIVGCKKQETITCDLNTGFQIVGDHRSGGLYTTPEGQVLTKVNNTVAIFGQSGVTFRVFYSTKNGSYFLAENINSGNCTTVGPDFEYIEAYPTFKGEICKNKKEMLDYYRFVAVDELRPSCKISKDKAVEAPNIIVKVPDENQESSEPVISPQQNPSCSDSDSGLDYYTRVVLQELGVTVRLTIRFMKISVLLENQEILMLTRTQMHYLRLTALKVHLGMDMIIIAVQMVAMMVFALNKYSKKCLFKLRQFRTLFFSISLNICDLIHHLCLLSKKSKNS